MKEIQLFKRAEIKFIVDEDESIDIIDSLEEVMQYDEHVDPKKKFYKVNSIYFDTEELKLMNLKINYLDEDSFKWKLRVRWYGDDLENCKEFFLEVKKKLKDFNTKKMRIKLNKEEFNSLINDKKIDFVIAKKKKRKEILNLIEGLDLSKKVLIQYQRKAMVNGDGVRVTFDYEVKGHSYLDNEDFYILSDDLCILEMKVEKEPPQWLLDKVTTYSIEPSSFSKYKGTRYILKR
jgi:hypothetical protein